MGLFRPVTGQLYIYIIFIIYIIYNIYFIYYVYSMYIIHIGKHIIWVTFRSPNDNVAGQVITAIL
jgi:hypothetical protein